MPFFLREVIRVGRFYLFNSSPPKIHPISNSLPSIHPPDPNLKITDRSRPIGTLSVNPDRLSSTVVNRSGRGSGRFRRPKRGIELLCPILLSRELGASKPGRVG